MSHKNCKIKISHILKNIYVYTHIYIYIINIINFRNTNILKAYLLNKIRFSCYEINVIFLHVFFFFTNLRVVPIEPTIISVNNVSQNLS